METLTNIFYAAENLMGDYFPITFAFFIGAAIGVERQLRDKAAGLRTMIFICVGAALFTLLSMRLPATGMDPSRIAANIVNGVGFLGAGVILRSTNGRIVGVTTAAMIWLTAALGMGIACRLYGLVTYTTVLALLILAIMRRLTDFLDKLHEERVYNVTFNTTDVEETSLKELSAKHHLSCAHSNYSKTDSRITVTCRVSGARSNHSAFVKELLTNDRVERLQF